MNKLTQEEKASIIDELSTFVDRIDFKDKLKEDIKAFIQSEFTEKPQFDEDENLFTYDEYKFDENNPRFKNVKWTKGFVYREQVDSFIVNFFADLVPRVTKNLIRQLKEIEKLEPSERSTELSDRIAQFKQLESLASQDLIQNLDPPWNGKIKKILFDELLSVKEQVELLRNFPTNNSNEHIHSVNNTESESIIDLDRNSGKYGYGYIYEDDLFLAREIKPENPILDPGCIRNVYDLDVDQFKSMFYLKLGIFKQEFEAGEAEFLQEYISFFNNILNVHEMPYEEIDKMYDYEAYYKPTEFQEFEKGLSVSKLMVKVHGEKKFIYSTKSKLNFLIHRLNQLKKIEHVKNGDFDMLLSDDDKSSKTKYERLYFLIVERFNVDFVDDSKYDDNDFFEATLDKITDKFINEIIENATVFDKQSRDEYLSRIEHRLSSLSANFKAWDNETNHLFPFLHRVVYSPDDENNVYSSDIKIYFYIVNLSRNKILDYIENILRIGREKNSPDKKCEIIDDFESIFNKEKKEFVLNLLEDLSITKDGKSIISYRKKSAMLGLVEALRKNNIAPEIDYQKLCKIIGNKIGLEIKYNLESSKISDKYKIEAEKYIKRHYIQ